MDMFNKVFNLDSEKMRKMALLKATAASSEKGTCYFMELDYCLVLGMYLITGEKNDGTNDKSIELRFVNQPEYYPKVLSDRSDVIKLAYNNYVKKNFMVLQLTNQKESTSKITWTMMRHIWQYILVFDKAIKQ
jgi:hypothetical protein